MMRGWEMYLLDTYIRSGIRFILASRQTVLTKENVRPLLYDADFYRI